MRRFFLIFLTVFTSSLIAQQTPFTCLSDNLSKTEISFKTPAFHLENDTKSNQSRQHLVFEDQRSLVGIRETGMPEIPTFSQLIEIPEQSRVEPSIEILEESTITDVYLSPTQSPDESVQNLEEVKNRKIYSEDKFFPENTISVTKPGTMRNHLVAQLQFNPIRYNPVSRELHIIKKATITINYISDTDGLRTNSIPTSSNFEKMIENSVLNPRIQNRENQNPGSYLFVYDGSDTVKNQIDFLADWKHRKGYNVNFLNSSEFGTSPTQVREGIRNLYNTLESPPEFICLVGDGYTTHQIPVFYETINGVTVEGDYPYTLLTENDDYPDAVVGRLPFNGTFELQTVISKLYSYEVDTEITTDWLDNIILVGDASSSGSSTITTVKYVKNVISLNYPDNTFSEIYEEPFASQISNAINEGSGAYFYRGFQGMSDWNPTGGLPIQNMEHPFIHVGLTCNNGYLTSNSYMEEVLQCGTPGSRIGMSAGIGSSSYTHTCFNNLMTGSIARSLYGDNIENLGTALLKSKIDLWNNFPNNPFLYLDWYNMIINLFGDPGMSIWKETPVLANVTHPEEIHQASNSMTVVVMNENEIPIENAWVTLLKDDEVFTSTYTNSVGEAMLSFNCSTTGELKLTVTHSTLKPYLVNIPVTTTDNFISIDSISNENNIQAGELASFNLNLLNHGSTVVENVTATISCDNELCEVIQNSSDFNSIPPGSTGESLATYEIEISPLWTADDCLDLTFNITSNDSTYCDVLRLDVNAPKLSLVGYNCTSDVIPGITTGISLEITNLGNLTFDQSDFIISSTSSYLDISDSTSVLAVIEPGETAVSLENDLAVTFTGAALPGMQILLQAQFTDINGLAQFVEFDVMLETNSVNDPTGPDDYGYFCYDDSDTAYDLAPVYNWIEIDPALGGDGNILNLQDEDASGCGDMETISLPFPLMFYGELYTQLSISSNGYVMPGSHFTNEWMNWSIPGAMVPSPIIAPFWDDLLIIDTINSAVCWKYEETEHAIIVEWSNLLNRYGSETETFQLLIYDPEYASSMMGDSVIKFQYKEINNVNIGSYDGFIVYHGQYATVGIGNEHSSTGLEYTFCNEYPVTAKTLQNEMAILFNGPDEQPIEASLLLSEISLVDMNGNSNLIPDAGETIHFSPGLRNRGLQTATDITATLSCNSEYITVTQGSATYPDILSNQSEQVNSPFIFEISDYCPNNYSAALIMNINFSGMTRELIYRIQISAPELILNNVTFVEDIYEDDHLGSNESGFFKLHLKKNSYLDLNNIALTLTCSEAEIDLPQPITEIAHLDSDSLIVEFPISVPDILVDGSNMTFTIDIAADNLSAESEFDYLMGHYQLLIFEDFTEIGPEWILENGEIVNENLAGGTGNELQFNSSEYYSNVSILALNDIAFRQTKIKFKYRQLNSNNRVSFWHSMFHEIWTNSIINTEPEIAEIILYNAEITEAHQFNIFIRLLASDQNQIFALDDFEIYYIPNPTSRVTGNITLNGGNGDVTETIISTGSYSVHPDADGNYSLDLPPGNYELEVDIEGYENAFVSNFELQESTVQTYDFDLDYLPPVTDLYHSLQGNTLNLYWSYNDLEDRNKEDDLRLDLSHFVVRYHVGSYSFNETSTDTTLTKELTLPGDYSVYVFAHYGNDDYSVSSDTLYFCYGSSSDSNEIPEVYQLAQNHPNPFNPRTTISFDLPEATSNCNLSIYNCKGQLVNTLVNEAKAAGSYREVWNGKDNTGKQVSSGVYMYKLSTKVNKTMIKKMILLK